jgi:hypothetical protein
MRFFTRELYERSQSAVDEVVDAAEEEWEIANERYDEHLRAIGADLPAHVRAFNELLLHAAVVGMIAREATRLVVVLRKDIPPRDLVILTYDLVDDPVLEPFAREPGDWLGPARVNFGEFDATHESGAPVYTQEIVFDNDWLLRLRFRDVRAALADPLYLAHQPGQALVAAPFLQAS